MQSCVLFRINRQLLVDIWLVYKTSHNKKNLPLHLQKFLQCIFWRLFNILLLFYISSPYTCNNDVSLWSTSIIGFLCPFSSPSIRMAGIGVTTALSAHQLPSARFHLHRSSVCVICDLEEGHGILAATRPLLSSESADCGALCRRTADFSLTVTPANCIIA